MTNGLFGRSNTRNVAWRFYCSGSQRRLIDCRYSSTSLSYESYLSAGVICQGNTSAATECEHSGVRLVGGQKISEGRVEICAYGYWSTVCYSNWNTVATKLVCKRLGFPTEGIAMSQPLMYNKCFYISYYYNNILMSSYFDALFVYR